MGRTIPWRVIVEEKIAELSRFKQFLRGIHVSNVADTGAGVESVKIHISTIADAGAGSDTWTLPSFQELNGLINTLATCWKVLFGYRQDT